MRYQTHWGEWSVYGYAGAVESGDDGGCAGAGGRVGVALRRLNLFGERGGALIVGSAMPARSSVLVHMGSGVLPGYAGLIRRLRMGDIYSGKGRYSRPLPLLERALAVADPTRHRVAR